MKTEHELLDELYDEVRKDKLRIEIDVKRLQRTLISTKNDQLAIGIKQKIQEYSVKFEVMNDLTKTMDGMMEQKPSKES